MERKIINIININVEESIVKIEAIYKHEKNKKIEIKTVNENEQQNEVNLKLQTINFSKDLDITKIEITIIDLYDCELNFKVLEDNKEYQTILLDNKNEEISPKFNDYIIFINRYKLKIEKDKIIINKKSKLDKIKNEIKKQIYALKKYKKIYLLRFLKKEKAKYYLFNDRIMYADDNGEELFDYINKSKKAIFNRCYFVLDKKSPRIKDVKSKGKVLIYGSLKHKIKYLNSRIVISSHASYYDRVYNPFSETEMDMYKDLIIKKFVFLQHGVIHNDVHTILNRPQIIADLFIVSTNEEYNEIISPKYMFNKEMVVCTGLARFDKLVDNKAKVILISPTWRTYLTDVEYGYGDKQKFEESEFYTRYESVLKNKELLNELKQSGYIIKFLLHPSFVKYKYEFEKCASENVIIITPQETRYSDLFKECSIFITDYSSTHFDIAYMQKPLIYYQFDRERFYNFHYGKGYFDYDKDGFGDVIFKEEKLIEEIIKYINTGCKIKSKYKKIIKVTYKYLDNNNSKRIYEQIQKIDSKRDINYRFNNVH